jgi:predicted 2-oxoglutarate/Fe(II)-dependent dioxygenase YbiX
MDTMAPGGSVMEEAMRELQDLLDGLGESIEFATSGILAPVLPGLEVEGVGSIGTPISPADAKRLIAHASQAPYGRGEETIVDTSVRNVWQIEPSQLVPRNAEWNSHLASIVAEVKEVFGIRHKVEAKLYKLLIYKKGSCFTAHRDTEKTPGMFATLVVSLPSRHEGGILVIKHNGQTKKIDFGGEDSKFKTQYAAFYADCQHEIKPVTAGYRVCLVYNLAIAGRKRQPLAPRTEPAVEKAADLLKKLFADGPGKLEKIAIPFKHQYTQEAYDPRALKGSDRALADVLVRAAELIDGECSFALLTHWQSGEANYDTWQSPGYSRRYSYYGSDDDDDAEDDDSSDDDADMGKVYEEELSLEHWLDPRGRKRDFGEIHIDEEEILGIEDEEDWNVRQEVHEATGNEGVSVERWYRQAVVVIWPREGMFSILAGEGQASAIPELERMATRAKQPAVLAAGRVFAKEIIDHWQVGQRTAGDEGSYSGRMLTLLERIGTVELAQRVVREILPKDFDGSEGKALQRLCQHFGWEHFGAELHDLLANQKPEYDYRSSRLSAIVSLIEPLYTGPPALTHERRKVCADLADPLVQVLAHWDQKSVPDWQDDENPRAGVVASVLHILASISATEHMDRFVTHVLGDKPHYGLHDVLIPDVNAVYTWLPKVPQARPAAERLLKHCLDELRETTARPVEPPKDWAREANLACDCKDCQALSRFLRDPTQQVARFPMAKERRRHIHSQIERHGCDCTHDTEHKGSPHTLVCKKTQASYVRRLRQYQADQKLLAELEAIASDGRPKAKSPARKRRTAKP